MFGNCGPRYSLRWWWSDVYLRRFGVWYIIHTENSVHNTIIYYWSYFEPECYHRSRFWIQRSIWPRREFSWSLPVVHLKRKQTQCKEEQTKNSAAGIWLCITETYSIFTLIRILCIIQMLLHCACFQVNIACIIHYLCCLQSLRDRAERCIELNYEFSVEEQCRH